MKWIPWKDFIHAGYTYYTQGCTKWFDFAKITKNITGFYKAG